MRISRLGLALSSLVLLVACGAADTADESALAEGAATTSTLALLAGGLGGPGTTDGIGANARLSYPESVVADGHGSLYVADGRSIRKITVATGEVKTLAGGALGHADGTGAAASFDHPTGLAIDGAGNLFVSDLGDGSIRRLVLATGTVSTVVAGAAEPGSAGPPSARGLAVHDGSLYVASPEENTIRRVAIATGASTVIAGGDGGTADGIGEAAQFRAPRAIASDGSGHLFVADTGNHTVRRIDLASGEVTTIAGTPGAAGSTDGVGAAARFDEPRSVVVDGAGGLYVTTKDQLVRRIVIATGAVSTVAGVSGAAGAADGAVAAARFKAPFGVAEMAGEVFVADTGNNAIRRLAAGVVTTLVGKAAAPGAVDGTGKDARFDGPTGVAIDENDDVFVADRINLRIRKVAVATGEVSTFAGGAPAAAPYDGVGEDARFLSPLGVAADRRGHVFVADGSNIRRIDLATKKVTTLAYLLRDFNIGVVGIAATAEGVFVHDRLRVYSLPVNGGAPTVVAGGAFGSVDGSGSDARFLRIDALASDRSNALFVVDGGESRHLRRIVPATGAVTTLQKLPADRWDASPQPEHRGLAIDGSGTVFIGGWQDVFRLAPGAETATRFIGTGGQAGVKLGALPAALAKPRGLALTSRGALVIADGTENALLVAR